MNVAYWHITIMTIRVLSNTNNSNIVLAINNTLTRIKFCICI